MDGATPSPVPGDAPQPRPGQAVRFFDGRSTARRLAWARIEGEALIVEFPQGAEDDPGEARRHALPELALGERWQTGSFPVGLPGGATLWLDDADPGFVAALVRGAGLRQTAATLWRSWPAALACAALLVALVVWIDRQGAGLVARALLPALPVAVDNRLGDVAWDTLEKTSLKPSRRAAVDAGLQERFEAMARACGQGRAMRLLVRDVQRGSNFNAFALPNGTIVILDGMLDKLDADEALAVLGHEIGHVVHRHSMAHVMKSVGLLTVAGTVLGDFSNAAASAVGTVQFLRQSREAEREADVHARTCLAAAGLDPRVMVSLWRKVAEQQAAGADGPPAWLDSHPATEERLRAAQQP